MFTFKSEVVKDADYWDGNGSLGWPTAQIKILKCLGEMKLKIKHSREKKWSMIRWSMSEWSMDKWLNGQVVKWTSGRQSRTCVNVCLLFGNIWGPYGGIKCRPVT